jgi:hypothetical protein
VSEGLARTKLPDLAESLEAYDETGAAMLNQLKPLFRALSKAAQGFNPYWPNSLKNASASGRSSNPKIQQVSATSEKSMPPAWIAVFR